MPPPPIVVPGMSPAMLKPPTSVVADLNAPYAEPYEMPPVNLGASEFAMPPGGPTNSAPCFWMNTDYLFWWMKKAPLPTPLVVTGPSTDPFPGALDQPNTKVLYGGHGIGFNPFSGVRTSLGLWFGNDNRFGFEMTGFILEQKANQFRASGGATGNPFIARPFINAQTGFENVYFVSQNFADLDRSAFMTGGIDVSSKTRTWSWEANGLYNFNRDESTSTSVITGFRSVGLREKLHISESLQNLNPGGGVFYLGSPVDPSTRELTFDKFDAQNTFYGGTLGLRSHIEYGRLSVDLTGKASIGVIQQLVDVEGFTAIDAPNGKIAAITPGGVYAVASNIGRHYQERFGVVPEGNINLSYEMTKNVFFRAGYSFLYINSVLRPGNQIDRNVNPALVPSDATFGTGGGPNSPVFPFHTSSVWLQGANLGFEFRY